MTHSYEWRCDSPFTEVHCPVCHARHPVVDDKDWVYPHADTCPRTTHKWSLHNYKGCASEDESQRHALFDYSCTRCQQHNNVISNFRGPYFWLSNFYLAPVEYDGLLYPSTEHAYQAAKVISPADRLRFLPLTAGGAKRLGNDIIMRDDWEQRKRGVMADVVRIKFTQHADLARKLLDTDDAVLLEGNAWADAVWGVSARSGYGKNWLGEILMDVREELHKW